MAVEKGCAGSGCLPDPAAGVSSFHDSGENRHSRKCPSARIVIPAKAGIYRQCEAWIPAFAGMTIRFEGKFGSERAFIPASRNP